MVDYRFPFYEEHPITSPYGPRGGGFHAGTDFGWTPETGTSFDVCSVADGVVSVATWAGEGSGNAVYVDHPDGGQSRYFHLEQYVVAPGQGVSAGQLIAHSGDTGVPGQPHLHLEMLDRGGNRYDPMQVLQWPDATTPPPEPAPEPGEDDVKLLRTPASVGEESFYVWGGDGPPVHVDNVDQLDALRSMQLTEHELLQVEIDRVIAIYR